MYSAFVVVRLEGMISPVSTAQVTVEFWIKKKKKVVNRWGGDGKSSKGFPGGSASKESTHNAGDPGSIPGLGRSSGERNVGNGSGRDGKVLVIDMFLGELWGCGPELELTCQKGRGCSLTSRLVWRSHGNWAWVQFGSNSQLCPLS